MELLSISEYELVLVQNGNKINAIHQGDIKKVIDENSPTKMKTMVAWVKSIEKLYNPEISNE